ncbi:MAG TPA: DUF5916 domain-containing protein [Longimicrobiaceae bacterium]|nr:DUF5916 domain-containing protein [Longimicrobiaceae bacterium]
MAVPLQGQGAATDSTSTVVPTLHTAAAGGVLRIDGRLDEEAWGRPPAASDFVQRRPDPGAPATTRTEVRILLGEGVLYVGARLYDSPDSVAAQLARRDASGIYSDWFTVMLDSDNDKRSAYYFSINPRGVRRDGLTSESGRTDLSWDPVWEASARSDSLGWTAELSIPLSQIRFSPEQLAWGVNFGREVARRDELAFWAALPPNQPGYVSRFGQLSGVVGLRSPGRLEVEPYSVMRLTRAPGDRNDPFYSANDLVTSMGMDLRYRVSDNLTLTGTANPDFGQVEADPAVVNLTAFESFFPEKRPFFVQGADIFDFRIGSEFDDERLFYSRRIGRSPSGSPPRDALFRDIPDATTILGAAKLSGKTARGWSVGVLEALTASEHAYYATSGGEERRLRVEPLTNYAAARVIKDFRAGRSALGTIFTATNRQLPHDQSLDFLRSAAYAGGFDGRHRFGKGNYEITGWMVGSRIEGSTQAIQSVQLNSVHYFNRPDADHLELDPGRTSLAGYAGDAQIAKIGGNLTWKLRGNTRSPGFEINDLGYERQADRITQAGEIKYSRYRPGPIFRYWNLALNQGLGWTHGGERVESFANLNSAFQLKNFWSGFILVGHTFPALSVSQLFGGPAIATPSQSGVFFTLAGDRRKVVSPGLLGQANFTGEAGGRSLSFGPSVSLRPSPRWDLMVESFTNWSVVPAQYVDVRRVGQETHYFVGRLEQTTTSLTARLNYTFTPTLSLQLYAQPFISAGDFTQFRRVTNPRAGRFDERFQTFSEREVALNPAAGRYRVDLNGDGGFDTDFRNPAFNVKQLRSNAVLRWEYRPGSTLYVVWNQGRREFLPSGSFTLDRDVGRLFRADGTNVLQLKLSYWFNM